MTCIKDPLKRAKITVQSPTSEDALSPVIGEMLMIVLALLLVSLFSLSLTQLLPAGRDYTIDIAHNESEDGKTLFLWHKGGDWVETSRLEVMIIQGRITHTFPAKDPGFHLVDITGGKNSRTFDLGDRIELDLGESDPPFAVRKGDIIRLVSSRNVIFSGTANP
jgi:hypothetical protein